MLNRKTIERALAQYADHRDADVARRLALYGPMLLAAADVKKKAVVSAELPEGKDLAKYLLSSTAPILSTGALTLDRASMEAGVKEVLAALVEGLKPEADVLQLINGLDWSAYLTDEMLKLASTDPVAWLERSREAAAGLGEAHEALVDMVILPVLGYTLRAHLDRFATEVSNALERVDDPVTSHERRTSCPVCGAPATFSAVVPTSRSGNVKKLFCECCGASWKFERIRCAVCGDEAVSDLEYVHDEGDTAHRLHVCRGCGEATPTLFAPGDEETFSADVESIVMTGLEMAYEESRAAESADTKDA